MVFQGLRHQVPCVPRTDLQGACSRLPISSNCRFPEEVQIGRSKFLVGMSQCSFGLSARKDAEIGGTCLPKHIPLGFEGGKV